MVKALELAVPQVGFVMNRAGVAAGSTAVVVGECGVMGWIRSMFLLTICFQLTI